MEKLNVAIIGQGRSGRDIHGYYFKSENNVYFNVVAIVDIDPERRERALEEYPGCAAYESHTDLYNRTDIDLVVNATYSNEHYRITKDLLQNKFNVLVEKPFARTQYECDDLIRIAKENNVVLGVFQQTFFAPYYLGAKEIVESGKLGEIKQVSIKFNSFERRWDWQATQVRLGGGIYNTGPHTIGLGLGFLDFADDFTVAYSKLGKTLTFGDSDDYAKIILTAPNKPVIDIEVSCNDAYRDSLLKIMGTKGTLKSSAANYELKYIVDGENPERTVVLGAMKDENGLPAYCREKLVFHEESGEYVGNAFDVGTSRFYEMMYNKLTKNTPMEVTPEHASKIINVIERVHAANPLPVIF